MKRATVVLHLDTLKKVLDLPEDVHVAGVDQTGHNKEFLHVTLLCERDQLPNISIDSSEGLEKIGYAFRHPEEFQQDNKGSVRGKEDA
jgi:hypothetical protein